VWAWIPDGLLAGRNFPDGGTGYFSMLFIFGGLGLGAAYLIEERKAKNNYHSQWPVQTTSTHEHVRTSGHRTKHLELSMIPAGRK